MKKGTYADKDARKVVVNFRTIRSEIDKWKENIILKILRK
jgi:hypothetical protein